MYIGGTIHVLRESDRPFPAGFDQAYDASDMLVFETDIARLNSPEVQQKIIAQGIYSDDQTLDSVLSPETYKKLKEYCSEQEISLELMNKFKPSMVMFTLLAIELQKLGINFEGIDLFYHNKAAADDKPEEGLESIDKQIEILTSLADGNEDNFILYSIEDLKSLEEIFEQMSSAWKIGDIEKLEELFISEIESEFPELFKVIIVERNTSWMPEIEKFLQTPETEFVLVGVAHLVGEDGVLELLKKRGYKIEKLK